MRVIAFHLPQFHPIPENDQWWGKGFTEWTKVSRARPLFPGHRQPRLPADLGFYDLRLPEALEAQAELARAYGIHGFCYHYYFFGIGRRLLERPIERMLGDGRPDFPFCLCWANENWSRRWDGLDHEILIRQTHDADSDLAFWHSLLPYFRDRRYIRVGSRPLLVIYRASLFPDLATTVARWRAEAQHLGEEPPYLVGALSFDVSPVALAAAGFDACCDFPPHGLSEAVLPPQRWPAFQGTFAGTVVDYERSVAVFRTPRQWPLRHCSTVALDWDNSPRRELRASITANFSLPAYHRWLAASIAEARASAPLDEQLVFINSWNEWAEGSYLEPDQWHGKAGLEATRAAIRNEPWNPAKLAAAPAEAIAREPALAASIALRTPPPTGRLRLVGVAMVGNEADIVEAFVRENCRYLDQLLIAEHCTIDGTSAVLDALVREGLPLLVEHLDQPSYTQTSVVNALLRRALAEYSPDWVIPIDADEFIDASDRAQLEAALLEHPSAHASWPWVNHAPTGMDDTAEPHPLRRLRHRYAYPLPTPEENPWTSKILLNARLIRAYFDRYELEKGSHRLTFRGTKIASAQPVRALSVARLRHFPVRSYDQLALKIGLGTLQLRMAENRNESAAIHWSLIWEALLSGRRDVAMLQSACREYLDTGRKKSHDLQDVPLVCDEFPVHRELLLTAPQMPAVALYLRWLEDRADGGKRGPN